MDLNRSAEPSGSRLNSHNRLTNDLATNTNLGRTCRTPRGRRRADAPPTHVHKYPADTSRWIARKPPKLQRCSICLESRDSSLWVRLSTLCKHEPTVCEPCVGQYVISIIKEGLVEVLCPDLECRKEMKYGDVVARVCGDEEYLSRYKALRAQRELERQPNFVWCTNPRCERGQLHDQGVASPLVTCRHCHTRTCFVHRVPWHQDLTCEQYSKHKEENDASEEYVGKHTKRCPNTGCKRPIEKIDGCDHMTCSRPGGCGHEFCWSCLADYAPIRRDGNHRHNVDCPHYAGLTSAREAEIEGDSDIEELTIELLRPIAAMPVRRLGARAGLEAGPPIRPGTLIPPLLARRPPLPLPLPPSPPTLRFPPVFLGPTPSLPPGGEAPPRYRPGARPGPLERTSLLHPPRVEGGTRRTRTLRPTVTHQWEPPSSGHGWRLVPR